MRARAVVVIQGADSIDQVPGIEAIDAEAELRCAGSVEALGEALHGADVLLGWSFREGGLRAVWPKAGSLRWIHWTGAGVDALLFPELVASDVVLTNARGVFDRAMAEYVLGLILSFAKRFPETTRHQTERRWEHRLGEMITGKRALVVGVGSIGTEIARMLKATGMRVEGIGRRARSSHPVFDAVHANAELLAALGRADYVVIVVPLTDATRGMFGAAELAAMRPTARLVNVARGAVLDESALVEALRDGRIAGAALDVAATEPLPIESPLWDLPSVIVSPHMSGDFVGYQEALVAAFVENFYRYRRGEILSNVVDKASGFVPSGDSVEAPAPSMRG